MRGAMNRHLLAVAAVVSTLSSVAADEVPPSYGTPPRILIASGIESDGNLIVSATEQRQKKVAREVEKDGQKATRVVTVTYPVMVLKRQTVSLKGVTISDLGGNRISIDQARQRLREPTPILMTLLGEKV